MLAFFLYLLVGLLTGAHVSSLVLLGAWGVPVHVLEYVALGGAILMVVSAGLTLFAFPAGSRLALIAALVQWSFYLPAARQLVHASWHSTEHAPLVLASLALAFLALATVYAALAAAGIARPLWMFSPVSPNKRRALSFSMSALVLLAVIGGVVASRITAQRFTFIFPPNYTGWVRLDFGVPGAAPLPWRRGSYVVEVPPTGMLRTATTLDYQHASADYEYAGGARKIPAIVSAGFVIAHPGGKDPAREYLFVGSAEEHRQHESDEPAPDGLPRPGPLAQVAGK